jgi:hypothetical protein
MTTSYQNKELPALVNLTEIIAEYFNEIGDVGMSRFFQVANIAIRGVGVIYMRGSVVNLKTYEATPDALNRISLPDDCVKVSTVSLNINERLYPIDENKRIHLPRKRDCGADTRDVTVSNANIQFLPFYSGNIVRTFYGLTGGYDDCYYRIDDEMRYITIEGEIPADITVVIQYKSRGISVTVDTLLPIQIKESVIAWIYMKMAPMGSREREAAKAEFSTALAELRKIERPLNLDEWIIAGYRSLSQGIQR